MVHFGSFRHSDPPKATQLLAGKNPLVHRHSEQSEEPACRQAGPRGTSNLFLPTGRARQTLPACHRYAQALAGREPSGDAGGVLRHQNSPVPGGTGFCLG